jgi:hypothetical protein
MALIPYLGSNRTHTGTTAMSGPSRQNSYRRSLGALTVFTAALVLQGASLLVFEHAGHDVGAPPTYRATAPVFTLTVTTGSPTGPGNIYDAVQTLNDTPTCDFPGSCVVNFDLPVTATVDMTGTLSLNSPIIITGEDNPGGKPVLDFSNNADSPGNGIEVNAAGVTLESLRIQNASWNNVLVSGNDALILNSDLLSSSSRHGAEVNGATGAQIVSSTVEGNLGNLYIENGGLELNGVDVQEAGIFNLSGFQVKTLDISGTTITGGLIDSYGVDVSLVSSGTMTVINSTIEHAGEDFLIFGGQSVEIVETDIRSAPFGGGGIILGGTEAVTIANVTIESGEMNLSNLGSLDLSDVVILDPSAEGIFLNSANADAIVNSVVITGSSFASGLNVFSVGTMTVTNSTFADNSSDGVRINEGTLILNNSRSVGNAGNGIRVTGPANVTVQSGAYSDNAGDGINIGTSGKLSLLGPTITGNGGDAVDVGSDGHTPNVQGDDIVDWPEFLSYNLSDGNLIFAYRPETEQPVDVSIYVNDLCDEDGYGQLRYPLANETISPVDLETAVYTATVPINAKYAVGLAVQDFEVSESGNCVLGASASNVDSAVLSEG